jgi:tetratricopeptide (TPR) repeat protein
VRRRHALARRPHHPDRDPEIAGGIKLAYILHNLANVHRGLGEDEQALALLQRSLRLTQDKYLPIQASYHHTAIAHMLLQHGRIEESLDAYRTAVAEARRAKFSPGLSQALAACGEVLFGAGRVAEAVPHLQEAGTLFEQLKDDTGAAKMWATLALAHLRQHDTDSAQRAALRAASVYRRLGNASAEMRALEVLARAVPQVDGGLAESRGHYEAALAIALEIGDRAAEARLRNSLGIIAWTEGDFPRALDEYRRALPLFRDVGDGEAVGLTLNSIGFTLLRLGRHDDAEAALTDAVDEHRTRANELLEAHARTGLGEVFESTSLFDDARAQYQASLDLRQAQGDASGAGWTLRRLARLAARAGDVGAADALARRARELADQCGDTELRDACDSAVVHS